jgi:SAM-dependent methyltransferase
LHDNIERARQGFEESFAEAEFYNRQTRDSDHLSKILNVLEIQDGDKILDLGTGSGYLTFAIAKKHPKATVIGLDIVSETLAQNNKSKGIPNIEFINYDGMALPFENNSFDWIVSRYAIHHFPDIQFSFNEMARVLKEKGHIFISDPSPNEDDFNRFVDSYMQLKDDGHNKFYTFSEFSEIAESCGLNLSSSFTTSIRFPRKITNAYIDLLKKTDEVIIQSYNIEVAEDECYISENVLNLLFKKD